MVVDACSLLNLYVAEGAIEGLSRLGVRLAVVPQVRAEALFVYRVSRNDGNKTPVNLEPFISTGAVAGVDLNTTREMDRFIAFASRVASHR